LAVNDDYLWNKTGRDPEIEALEELLAPLRYGARGVVAAPQRERRKWPWVVAALATAAALVLTIRWWIPATESAMTNVAQTIDLKQYGSVDVHAGAVVQVVRNTDEDIRLRLERGPIEARISLAARPRLFQVETPATTCVDLGCHYTLTVDADGSTFVRVDVGQVAFVEGGRETWIPSGASCRAWPSRGSGTPCWDDAAKEMRAAVALLDRAKHSVRSQAAKRVIELCDEKRDALSLWHLAHDADPQVSGAAWTALIRLVGAPRDAACDIDALRAPEAAERWKAHLEELW
jgi:hypothetical protein